MTRASLPALLTLGLALPALSAAAQDKDPRAIIDRAIEASGGAEKLQARTKLTWDSQGTYHGLGTPVDYTASYAVAWPGKMRMEVQGQFVIVLADDKGWVQYGGVTQDMDESQLKEQRESNYAGWVTSLLPLVKEDAAFSLKLAGEEKVNDQPAVGVTVSHKNHRDVTLYFDQKSGLLAKSVSEVFSQEQGEPVKGETTYKDYKEVDGLMLPHSVVVHRDGELFVEGTSSDLRFVKEHEEGTFARP